MRGTGADGQKETGPATGPTGRMPRLLPWTSEAGNACYLSTDSGSSMLSGLADEMEEVQLSMGEDVLGEARRLLSDPLSPHAEVRYAGIRLAECLVDALRVAESRGMRLPVPDSEEHAAAEERPAPPAHPARPVTPAQSP
ncbi:hypothetical protein San01_48030 [Streptomyces angustmyceticus]|uniref:Uncharacterized protein n=2 Tax=Streptomyces angustmyceticus TaxID=285578 RepID=A0A5J4LL40_9ACTN|nr:hypothetical protein San01_48030 [Streptomyces angustmyceticus]